MKRQEEHLYKPVNLISNKNENVVIEFKANINVIRANSTTIKKGYEPMFHAYSIRQVVKIIDIQNKKNARKNSKDIEDDNILRNGDSATVLFQFKYKPEFIKIGTRFILCEGRCKIIGEIISV
jgi:GTPase